jgi:two-component system NtrC family response regulator
MADGSQVTAKDLGIEGGETEPMTLNLREARRLAESKAIRIALTQAFGKISRAAELLGVTRPTLYDLLNKYGLSAENYTKRANSLREVETEYADD